MFTGHPKGLFRLFFIEMWERLAFYTMVGILLLYTIDNETGGLGMPKVLGNEIYGLYLAFVYFTPYLGGLVADRFLGYRKSVLCGGLLFAAGFFLLALGQRWSFVTGLVFLCVGNGLFKPNISAMVGNLYAAGDPKRDSGFNIFYMGINIGAFIANFLAMLMRNWYGWLAIFIAAGVGMLIGIVILLWSWRTLEAADREPASHPDDTGFGEILQKIIGPALVVGVIGYYVAENFLPEAVTSLVRPSDIGFLIGAIPIILFFVRLSSKAEEDEKPGLRALLPIYVAGGAFFMVLHLNGSAMTIWAKESTDRRAFALAEVLPDFAKDATPGYYDNASPAEPRPNRLTLLPIADERASSMYGQKRMDEQTLAGLVTKLPADVAVVDLDSAAGVSEQDRATWKKRAVDVFSEVSIEESPGAHGGTELTVKVADGVERLRRVAFVRTLGDGARIATFVVTPDTFDSLYEGDPPQLDPGEYLPTVNPELYQSFNPLFVILFTPLVVGFFTWLLNRGVDFSTARKMFAGMVITGVALLFMAAAGFLSNNGETKVSWMWLAGFYAIITVGELCLSPMALSLVTKLSPARFVGLTMGGWFFAVAVGNKFSGFLGGIQGKMEPSNFFLVIAGGIGVVAFGLFLLLPKLDAAIKKYGA